MGACPSSAAPPVLPLVPRIVLIAKLLGWVLPRAIGTLEACLSVVTSAVGGICVETAVVPPAVAATPGVAHLRPVRRLLVALESRVAFWWVGVPAVVVLTGSHAEALAQAMHHSCGGSSAAGSVPATPTCVLLTLA